MLLLQHFFAVNDEPFTLLTKEFFIRSGPSLPSCGGSNIEAHTHMEEGYQTASGKPDLNTSLDEFDTHGHRALTHHHVR